MARFTLSMTGPGLCGLCRCEYFSIDFIIEAFVFSRRLTRARHFHLRLL